MTESEFRFLSMNAITSVDSSKTVPSVRSFNSESFHLCKLFKNQRAQYGGYHRELSDYSLKFLPFHSCCREKRFSHQKGTQSILYRRSSLITSVSSRISKLLYSMHSE